LQQLVDKQHEALIMFRTAALLLQHVKQPLILMLVLQVAERADMALLPCQRHHHCGGQVQHQHLRLTRSLQLPAVGLAGMVSSLLL
jgi:hypothetical protein